MQTLRTSLLYEPSRLVACGPIQAVNTPDAKTEVLALSCWVLVSLVHGRMCPASQKSSRTLSPSFRRALGCNTPVEWALASLRTADLGVMQHGSRTYATAAERAARFATFAKNLARIEAHNAEGHSFQLGINEFADVEPEEFASSHFGMSAESRPWSGLPYLGRDPQCGSNASSCLPLQSCQGMPLLS